jgi:hypothetical protein
MRRELKSIIIRTFDGDVLRPSKLQEASQGRSPPFGDHAPSLDEAVTCVYNAFGETHDYLGRVGAWAGNQTFHGRRPAVELDFGLCRILPVRAKFSFMNRERPPPRAVQSFSEDA